MKRTLFALVTLFCFSLVGLLGEYWWVFDLAAHLRVFYILSGGILLLLTVWYRRYALSIVVFFVMLIHAIPVISYSSFFAEPQSPMNSSPAGYLKVAYINSYWMQENMDTLIPAVRKIDADIFFLEEMQPEQYAVVKEALSQRYPYSHHEAVPWAFDIAVFSKRNLESIRAQYFYTDVPTLHVEMIVNNKKVQIFGVHPYSPMSKFYENGRDQLLTNLFVYLRDVKGPVIVGGDFNLTQYSPMYKKVTKDSNLIDTATLLGTVNTWPTKLPEFLRIPIDQVFVSPDVRVFAKYTGPDTGSDHAPLIVELGV